MGKRAHSIEYLTTLTISKVDPLYLPGYITPRVGNLTEEKVLCKYV
jgi:hypothetical protein